MAGDMSISCLLLLLYDARRFQMQAVNCLYSRHVDRHFPPVKIQSQCPSMKEDTIYHLLESQVLFLHRN